MTSDNIKLRFALFCDYAFITQDNKLSIIGEFDRLRSTEKGKSLLRNGFVVASFDIVRYSGEKLWVTFTNEKGEEFSQKKELKFHADGGRANFLIKLINLTFPGGGRYYVTFLTQENEEIAKAHLDVSLLPPVIHE